jgi:predicted ferric reductase
MSQLKPSKLSVTSETTNETAQHSLAFWVALGVVAALLAMIGVVLVGLMAQMTSGMSFGPTLSYLLGLDSGHATWYITRSAGFIAYLLLWLSTVWGLAVSSKVFDKLLHRAYTFDFHEFLSLLSIGFLVLHIVILLFDQYLPYSLAQILVPFISPYRPVWVGVGVIAFYLTLLVSVTFYIRSRISMKTFRVIHLLSFVAYIGSAVHGLLSGTDSPLLMTGLMYAFTFLVVVFLTVYWLFTARSKRTPVPAPKPVAQAARPLQSYLPVTQPDTSAFQRPAASAPGKPGA